MCTGTYTAHIFKEQTIKYENTRRESPLVSPEGEQTSVVAQPRNQLGTGNRWFQSQFTDWMSRG